MGIKTRKPSSRSGEPGNGVQNSVKHHIDCARAQELLAVAASMRAEAKVATEFDRQVELAQEALIAERELRRHHKACPMCLAEEAQVAA